MQVVMGWRQGGQAAAAGCLQPATPGCAYHTTNLSSCFYFSCCLSSSRCCRRRCCCCACPRCTLQHALCCCLAGECGEVQGPRLGVAPKGDLGPTQATAQAAVRGRHLLLLLLLLLLVVVRVGGRRPSDEVRQDGGVAGAC
jgi:hypothetical protein